MRYATHAHAPAAAELHAAGLQRLDGGSNNRN
jgi:hypothetical protein